MIHLSLPVITLTCLYTLGLLIQVVQSIPIINVGLSDLQVVEPIELQHIHLPITYAIFSVRVPDAQSLEGYITLADPIDGCTPIKNDVKNTIVFMERGKCDFYDKASHASEAGGIGFLFSNVINRDLSTPAWGTSGKTNIIPIPGGSIMGSDGDIIYTLLNNNVPVRVKLTGPHFSTEII